MSTIVWENDQDEQGRRFLHQVTDRAAAVRKPFDVPISSMPPIPPAPTPTPPQEGE